MFIIKIITIFCSLIYLIKSSLIIIGPHELVSRYSNKPIDIVFRKNTDISNFYVHGEIILDNSTNQHTACSELGELKNTKSQNEYSENFKILLVKNGDCPITQKARNAQNAGASMLLVLNQDDSDINSVILDDDGSGSDIKIMIGLISLSDGKIMTNFIENNPNTQIAVEINFEKKNIKKKIEVKLFFSSSEKRAYELLSNLINYLGHFDDQVNFQPIYVVHQSPTYNPNNPVRQLNCFTKGKYCYFPKKTTLIQDGQKILLEDLRQKCMYEKNKEANIEYYFKYMNEFSYSCLNKTISETFEQDCSKKVLDILNFPVNYLDECISDSFGVNNLLSSAYIDNENRILKKEYDEILKYKLTSFPAVVVDDIPLEGIISENKMIKAICISIEKKPSFCSFFDGNLNLELSNAKKKRGWIYALIIVIIIINFLLYCMCRRHIKKAVGEKIDFNTIDFDGRINNFVQNYISLKSNQENDYKSFDSNFVKKSNELNEGKVDTL